MKSQTQKEKTIKEMLHEHVNKHDKPQVRTIK